MQLLDINLCWAFLVQITSTMITFMSINQSLQIGVLKFHAISNTVFRIVYFHVSFSRPFMFNFFIFLRMKKLHKKIPKYLSQENRQDQLMQPWWCWRRSKSFVIMFSRSMRCPIIRHYPNLQLNSGDTPIFLFESANEYCHQMS